MELDIAALAGLIVVAADGKSHEIALERVPTAPWATKAVETVAAVREELVCRCLEFGGGQKPRRGTVILTQAWVGCEIEPAQAGGNRADSFALCSVLVMMRPS